MKADVFLSTRNRSSRFPGKALMRLQRRTVTEHIIDRLKLARNISQVVLCTSTSSSDDPLIQIARDSNIEHFRGSEEDKLDRYLKAARKFGTDFIAVADGDDVFCEPSFIDSCVDAFNRTGADYVSIRDAPVGTVPFCVKTEALEKVCRLKNETNTEIWTGCFTDTGLFRTMLIDAPEELRRPDIRLTLDYKEDFVLLEKIFASLYRPGKVIPLVEVIEFLTRNPRLLDINRHMQEFYLQNQQRFQKITLRKDSP
ncbi:MAG: NTP transferase domain-containing protein [Nitrososphaera sp.]